MRKTREKLQGQLDTLSAHLPALVREHADDGDFWMSFAGASDFIVDDAGPDDYAWVMEQIDAMLMANGKAPAGHPSTDDRTRND